MNGFRMLWRGVSLIDLGYVGHDFTWSNGQDGVQNIQEGLNHGFANQTWCLIFPNMQVSHLPHQNWSLSLIIALVSRMSAFLLAQKDPFWKKYVYLIQNMKLDSSKYFTTILFLHDWILSLAICGTHFLYFFLWFSFYSDPLLVKAVRREPVNRPPA